MNIQISRYSAELRQLIDDYFYQQISLDEYQQQRKRILDAIDRDINHVQPLPAERAMAAFSDSSEE